MLEDSRSAHHMGEVEGKEGGRGVRAGMRTSGGDLNRDQKGKKEE